MRRKEREIKDPIQIREILDNCKVCRLAMKDKEGLYLVPLNFGYELDSETLTLYFHSAREGRKISALSSGAPVCFEMDCSHHLVEGDIPCGYTYEFQSLIGFGTAVLVDDPEEKKHALTVLMKHMTDKEFLFDDKMADIVEVIKIQTDNYTGKANRML